MPALTRKTPHSHRPRPRPRPYNCALICGACNGPAQNDIQSCRAAMTASSHINMQDYRLRFERSEGIRVETLFIKAIPRKSGQAFHFTCILNRDHVVAVNPTRKTLRLAAK